MIQMQSDTATAGTLDPTFGVDGVVEVREQGAVLYSVLPLNGKLIYADQYFSAGRMSMRLRRMNSQGIFESSFGDNGSTVLPIDWGTAPRFGLFPYLNGNFLVKGTYIDSTGQRDMVFALLNQDGQLDTVFGDKGFVRIDPYELSVTGVSATLSKDPNDKIKARNFSPAENYIGGSVCVQPDGKILASHSGVSGQDGNGYWWRGLLIRLMPDGTFDKSFNNTGSLFVKLGGLDNETISIALQSDGKILVFGGYYPNDSDDLNAFVIRYMANGEEDSGFNGGKPAVINHGDLKNILAGTISIRESDGAILMVGSASKTYEPHLPYTPWIAVLNPNGSPNLLFNNGRPLFSSILEGGGLWQNCTWQEDKILVAGSVAARYLSTGSLDTSFNGKGWFDYKSSYHHMALTEDKKLVLIGYAAGYPFVLRSLI
ncbi:hypothetical protein D3C71_427040 [compost metagenome]